MLANGTTKRCEQQLTAQDDNQIFHSGNGWCIQEVMTQYLIFLRTYLMSKINLHEKRPFLLIVDICKSHFDGNIMDLAKEMNSRMMFIPLGITAELPDAMKLMHHCHIVNADETS
jgi:hypothetical protein